jgi:hypothetical protein
VDQAGLELRNLPASASQVLGLKACATTTQLTEPFQTGFLTDELRQEPICTSVLDVRYAMGTCYSGNSWSLCIKKKKSGAWVDRLPASEVTYLVFQRLPVSGRKDCIVVLLA